MRNVVWNGNGSPKIDKNGKSLKKFSGFSQIEKTTDFYRFSHSDRVLINREKIMDPIDRGEKKKPVGFGFVIWCRCRTRFRRCPSTESRSKHPAEPADEFFDPTAADEISLPSIATCFQNSPGNTPAEPPDEFFDPTAKYQLSPQENIKRPESSNHLLLLCSSLVKTRQPTG